MAERQKREEDAVLEMGQEAEFHREFDEENVVAEEILPLVFSEDKVWPDIEIVINKLRKKNLCDERREGAYRLAYYKIQKEKEDGEDAIIREALKIVTSFGEEVEGSDIIPAVGDIRREMFPRTQNLAIDDLFAPDEELANRVIAQNRERLPLVGKERREGEDTLAERENHVVEAVCDFTWTRIENFMSSPVRGKVTFTEFLDKIMHSEEMEKRLKGLDDVPGIKMEAEKRIIEEKKQIRNKFARRMIQETAIMKQFSELQPYVKNAIQEGHLSSREYACVVGAEQVIANYLRERK